MTDMKNILKYIRQRGACDGGYEWVEECDTVEGAVAHCPDASWLAWTLDKLRTDGMLPVEAHASATVAMITDALSKRELTEAEQAFLQRIDDNDSAFAGELTRAWRAARDETPNSAEERALYLIMEKATVLLRYESLSDAAFLDAAFFLKMAPADTFRKYFRDILLDGIKQAVAVSE